jgi:Kef-type K+ transport system membrane component KefB
MTATRRHSAGAALAYGAMVVGTIALFVVIRGVGENLSSPRPATANAIGLAPAAPDILWHLLLALTAVVIAGQGLGRLFRWIGQPPVIGQIVAGILLGPSLLGRVAPEVFLYVLPAEVAPFLGLLAQLGVILYMFLVGLELNPDLVRGQVRSTVSTAHASIALPFVLGAALALYLYPRLSTSDVPFTHFALFLGVAMSITAFPVLARILAEQGMTRTRLGVLALTCAAVGDVTAWCLLAFVVGVVHAKPDGAIAVAALTAGFIGFMFVAVRPMFERLARSPAGSPPTRAALAVALTSMLVSALVTEAIGVHAIFGAFLLGAVIPHESGLARALLQSLEGLVTVLILPAFFAFTGMRTEIGLVSGWSDWSVVALIVLVASVGKFGGTVVAARTSGLDWRHATGLGVLMNTRGLMELIVLNVGLDLGVISPTLFTMLVLMALVTTVATTPVLQQLFPTPEPPSRRL